MSRPSLVPAFCRSATRIALLLIVSAAAPASVAADAAASFPRGLANQPFDAVVVEQSLRRPVVVEFRADWCPSCRRIEPLLATLAREYAGRIEFVQVDIDEHPALAERFRVVGVPTLVVFSGGMALHQLAGLVDESQLRSVLHPYATQVTHAPAR